MECVHLNEPINFSHDSVSSLLLYNHYSVASFPFSDDFVPQPVCGCCFIQCLPEFGICLPTAECKALEGLTGETPTAAKPVEAETMERVDGPGLTNPLAGLFVKTSPSLVLSYIGIARIISYTRVVLRT